MVLLFLLPGIHWREPFRTKLLRTYVTNKIHIMKVKKKNLQEKTKEGRPQTN